MLFSKIGSGAAVAAALMLGASPALAATGWTVVPVPTAGHDAALGGVSSTSDSDAWAVGSTNGELNGVGAKPLIDHWNGTTWSQATVPATPGNTASLAAVSASSPADAWAVRRTQVNRSDFAPLALHWNGAAWFVSASAASALTGQIGIGVADISPADAYAIGGHLGSAHTGLVAHWNGTSWARLTVPQPSNNNLGSDFDAISADGPNDVWIVGTFEDQTSPTSLQTQTYSLHFNGSTWTVVPMPTVGSSNVSAFFHLNAIKANSPADVWAVGNRGIVDQPGTYQTLIEHFNGTAWSIVPSPSPGTGDVLAGVTTSNAASNVWAVGSDVPAGASQAQTLTLNWNGTAWVTVASPDVSGVPNALAAVATTPGAAIVQAVGSTGTLGSLNPLSLQHGQNPGTKTTRKTGK